MNKTFTCYLLPKIFECVMDQEREYSNCGLQGYKTVESTTWLSTPHSNLQLQNVGRHSLECTVW